MDNELDSAYEHIRSIMIEIMAVLYKHNIQQVHMGGMLRLLGVEHDLASKHDSEFLELDENFVSILARLNKPVPVEVPQGTTFH